MRLAVFTITGLAAIALYLEARISNCTPREAARIGGIAGACAFIGCVIAIGLYSLAVHP